MRSFILFMSFTLGLGSEPFFKDCDVVQRGVVGERVKLNCQPNRPATVLEWYSSAGASYQRITDELEYKIESNGLLIKEVRLYHSQLKFKVTVSDRSGELASRDIDLRVYMKPRITADREVIGGKGDNVTLTCNATGVPAPTITWYDESAKVLPVKGNALELELLTPEDAGLYKCWAENSVGYASSSVLLEMNIPDKVGHPWEIQSVKLTEVTENGVTFKIDLPAEGPVADNIFATYKMIGRDLTENITWFVNDSSPFYTVGYLSPGAAYRFQFTTWHQAPSNSGPWYRRALDAYLLPDTPQLVIEKIDNTLVHLTWLQNTFNTIGSNPPDFYEIEAASVQRISEKWDDPDCVTTIKLPSCSSAQYKFDRTGESTTAYKTYRVRIHNKAGYTQSNQVWVPPRKLT